MGVDQLTINVYNIKGQSVISDAVNIAQQGNSELSISLPANLAKGIYLVSLEKQGKRLATKRITIL
jgi:methionine-rich copper-binding protein CopC